MHRTFALSSTPSSSNCRSFFRDTFPHLIDLFDRALSLVVEFEEPIEANVVALGTGDPWQEAVEIASQIKARALVIDNENSTERLGGPT
jgi:cobalamin biosynthesis Mg chelatase CobN